MSDRDQQREQRRLAGCEPEPASFESLLNGYQSRSRRVEEKCAPKPAPEDDAFYTPTPIRLPLPEPLGVPEDLAVTNTGKTAICAEGTYGDVVEVPAGSITEYFDWTTIPGVTDQQLNYLSGLDQTVFLQSGVDTISEQGKLNQIQARYVRDTLDSLINSTQSRAQMLAQSLLRCHWRSQAVTVSCPEGSETSDRNPVTLPEGAITSTVSQDQADGLALAEAQSRLRCLWSNDEIQVSCAEQGFPDEVPVDPEDVPWERRVGVVTLPAGTVTSSVSKEDANERALVLARSQLNCLYINETVELSCPAGAQGELVRVEKGSLTSTVSQADVDEQAQLLLQSSLYCTWLSAQVTATCEDVDVLVGAVTKTVKASTTKGIRQVTLPPGTFTSEESQEDADQQALLMAQMQLDCVYCNLLVAPVCAPASYSGPVPVTPSLIQPDWSRDITPGVPAGTYCSGDAVEAQQIAEAMSAIPVRVQGDESNCTFGNDELQAACVQSPGVIGPFTLSQGQDLSPNSSPNPFATDPGERVIRLAKDSVIVGADDIPDGVNGKTYVNQLAETMLLSFLHCFFESDAITVTCKDLDKTGTFARDAVTSVTVPARSYTSYTSKDEANALARTEALRGLDCYYESDRLVLTCASVGKSGVSSHSTTPVEVPVGMYTSYVSKSEANALADVSARLSLNCFWTNDEQIATCSDIGRSNAVGPGGIAHVRVQAGTYTSYASKSEANGFAKTAALMGLNCMYSNTAITRTCADEGKHGVAWASTSMVTVPAGTYTSYTSQAEADLFALTAARQGLNCFWTSSECRDSNFTPGLQPVRIGISPAGLITSYISQAEADRLACVLAMALKVEVNQNTDQWLRVSSLETKYTKLDQYVQGLSKQVQNMNWTLQELIKWQNALGSQSLELCPSGSVTVLTTSSSS